MKDFGIMKQIIGYTICFLPVIIGFIAFIGSVWRDDGPEEAIKEVLFMVGSLAIVIGFVFLGLLVVDS